MPDHGRVSLTGRPSSNAAREAEAISLLHRLLKPWFAYQPTQLIRRMIAGILPPSPGYVPIQTSWGIRIIADPTRVIGRSILTTGVFDIAVSEALARLISPGDTVVDAGANIGYMTLLASMAAGPGGRVLSFEPHPDLFRIMERNVAAVRQEHSIARTELHQSALGEHPGSAELHLPPHFESNDGVASMGPAAEPGSQSVMVRVDTLDGVLGDDPAALLKLDVEGFEPQVLRGSARTLAARRIRHIVFEEHSIAGSDVVRILTAAGYRIFSLGWSMRGPQVQPVEAGSLATWYEAPSFIGTLEPAEVLARCQPRGWLVLSNRLAGRRT